MSTITDPTHDPGGTAPAPGPPPDDSDPEQPGRLRRLRLPGSGSADLLVAAVFILAALWVTARLWTHLGSRIVHSQTADEVLLEWMLAHGARVLSHPENPFFTYQLGVPDGANLMANNAMLGLALPMAPLTMWLGAHVSFVVATTACLAASAYAWYHVLSRHFATSRSAAFLGAAFAGFGPGIVAHAGGQLNLIAGFLLPFIVWRAVNVQSPARMRNGVILGLLVTYQVFLSEEPLFITALALGLVLVIHAVFRWDQVRPHVPAFLTNLGVAAGVAGVLLAYPLWYQFFGPRHFSGMMPYATDFSMDLDAYLRLPTHSLGGNPSLAGTVDGGPEQNAYLGVGLVALLIVVLVRFWRDVRIRSCLLAAAVLGMLALGPTIRIHGVNTGVPAPYRLLHGLPLFDSLVPARLGLAVVVLCAVALALLWDHLATNRLGSPVNPAARPAWRVALVVVLLAVVPAPLPVMLSRPIPSFISDGMWRRYVDGNHSVLAFPVPTIVFPEGMRWSAAANQEMKLANGYFLGPTSDTNRIASFGPPERVTTRLVNAVAYGAPPQRVTEAQKRQVFDDLRYWRAAVVVVAPGRREEELREVAEQLFGPGDRIGGVWVWNVRDIADGTR